MSIFKKLKLLLRLFDMLLWFVDEDNKAKKRAEETAVINAYLAKQEFERILPPCPELPGLKARDNEG